MTTEEDCMTKSGFRAFAALLIIGSLLTLAGCGRRPPASAAGEIAPAVTADVATPNQLTANDRAAGWTMLFDGQTLKGWRGLGYPTVPASHWVVADGAIKKISSGNVPVQADGQPLEGGDLMTEATYGDFELAWEWRVTPGANSGVKYNVSEELSTSIPPKHAAKGFEYQIIDDDRHPDGKLVTHKTGDLYDLFASNDRKHLRPVGEWNASRIVFVGRHGEHWLNGEKVVEFDLGTPRMDTALAASKYRTIPWFAERRRGHIVLQDHGDEVYFRSIRIRDLDTAKR
jgi:predicted small lipoprotein YifL